MTWTDIKLGTQSGSFELHLGDDIVDEFIGAMEITDPRYARPKEPGKRRLVPPHIVPKLGLDPMYIDFLHANGGNGVFAKQQFKFFEPVYVGDVVKGIGRFIDTYERRDKRYVVFEGEFKNQAGVPVVHEHRTIMVVSPTFKIKD